MLPATLQGTTAEESRLSQPFSRYVEHGMQFNTVGYLLRTPQYGGRWISLLSLAAAELESSDACAALLCDSMCPTPFIVTQPEIEDLLTACALESMAMHATGNVNAVGIRWGCFLVTDDGIVM